LESSAELLPLPPHEPRAAAPLACGYADILAAKVKAQRVYDEAGRASRLAKAKGAHDDIVGSAHRLKADALELEASAAAALPTSTTRRRNGARFSGQAAIGLALFQTRTMLCQAPKVGRSLRAGASAPLAAGRRAR
jgi:hypothetical protein